MLGEGPLRVLGMILRKKGKDADDRLDVTNDLGGEEKMSLIRLFSGKHGQESNYKFRITKKDLLSLTGRWRGEKRGGQEIITST